MLQQRPYAEEMQDQTSFSALGLFILESGTALLKSGASCSRIRITMQRLANTFGLNAHIAIGAKAISLTLRDAHDKEVYNSDMSIPAQGINFKVLSGVSRLSWQFVERKMNLMEATGELQRILALGHYPRWLVLLVVSLAGAAFCFTFGGDWKQMILALGATFVGLFVKQELVKRGYNAYMITTVGAFAAASVVAVFAKMQLLPNVEQAFATCVLFLVPGVLLINSVTDLIDGNTLNGIDRGVMALIHAMGIAFGLAAAIYLFNLHA
jgi:uncharacterized membrane protein YjjP (DUF1212 family)